MKERKLSSPHEFHVLYTLYAKNQAQVKSNFTLNTILFLSQNGGLEGDPIPESNVQFFQFQAGKISAESPRIDNVVRSLKSRNLIKCGTKESRTKNGVRLYRNDYSITSSGSELVEASSVPIRYKHIKAAKILYNETPILKLAKEVKNQYPSYSENPDTPVVSLL